jgi:CHAT domain-containing protein
MELREQRHRDQKEVSERQRREHEAEKAEREQERREAKRDHDLSALRGRTAELEGQLMEAARRAAPKEITVLFLASSPEDQEPLRLDKETREIQKELRSSKYRDSIWFEWRLARRTTDLIQDLNEVEPQVLHFSGHGNRAELVFEDENGNATTLDNDQLRRLLQVGGDRIRLVVFNSCESAAQAQLACQYIDVAIGMETSIDDESAKTFAAQLYNSLGFGLSVADAFRQASLQAELAHGKDFNEPKLFTASGVDAAALVLVNPGAR